MSAKDVGAVKASHDSEEPNMQAVTTIGLDIAKSVFQVHGVDAAGKILIRRRRTIEASCRALRLEIETNARRKDLSSYSDVFLESSSFIHAGELK
jgi:hypothetical protein